MSDMNGMLYLFNSAFRGLYQKNVLNTLALPQGWTNEYRYRARGTQCQIPQNIYSRLPGLSTGTPCVIMYIDRFGAAGYRYHPLRLGTYRSYREEDEKVYLQIELGEFASAHDPEAFQDEIVQALGTEALPKLTNNDPECVDDGPYVAIAESLFDSAREFLRGDGAWAATADRLAGTTAFSTTTEDTPVFLRINLEETSVPGKALWPCTQGTSPSFELIRGHRYSLSVLYRYPRQVEDRNAKGQIKFNLGDRLRPVGADVLSLDSSANSIPVPFTVEEEDARGKTGSITLAALPADGQPTPLIYDRALEYRVAESDYFWLRVIFALILYAAAATCVGANLAMWQKFLAALAQALAMLWLFKLLGKKII